MTKISSIKGTTLAALLAVSLGNLEASASESATRPGQCNSNFAYNNLIPIQVTPALLEELRVLSGAAIVRHYKIGELHTLDVRNDRLRVYSEGNRLSFIRCGGSFDPEERG